MPDKVTAFTLFEKRLCKMRILITGGTGFIGTPLVSALRNRGHDVIVLRRKDADLVHEPLTPKFTSGVEAVIHLLGENIGKGRWTAKRKRELWNSRVNSSQNLLASFEQPPKVVLSASAVGYYGDRGDEELTENSKKGEGFLADLCEAWEEPFHQQKQKWPTTRFAQMRKGLVFAPKGGSFEKLLLPHKFFLGGRLGQGNQWMSWVMLDDVIAVYQQALTDERMSGPINVVSREPVQQRKLAQEINKLMGHPMGPPAPKLALRIILGEMSDALLSSQLTMPARLTDWDFQFQYPGLAQALQKLLANR